MLAMLAIGSTAYGEDLLKVENITMSSSDGITSDFMVNFYSDEKSSVSGVNFSIQLPDGVEFVTDGTDPKYEMGTTFDGSPQLNIVGNVLKVAMGSSNPIKGSHGMLIAFKIQPSDSYDGSATLTGGKIFDASESKNGPVALSESSFEIAVTDRIVLDENSPFDPTAGRNKNVLVKRTLKANTWSTICLPFAMTRAQLEDAFGEDVEVAEFSACDYDETNGITIDFESIEDGIAYGTPYLIKASSAISKFTANGVRIYAATQTAPEQDGTFGYGRMTGTLKLTKMAKNDIFLQDEMFYYAVAGQNIKGFRATFAFFDDSDKPFVIPANATSRAMINGKPIGDMTAINSKRNISETGRVYSISGRYMGENVDMKSLPKGVYVVDGIKIVND